MAPDPQVDITRLLGDWQAGDKAAMDRIMPIVQHELRRVAAAYLRRERHDHTLQPTALINEAYIRLMDQSAPTFESRAHFFGVAAQIMRQILVDFARKRLAAKRAAGQRETLDPAIADSYRQSEEVIAVHQALDRLALFDEQKARIMELRHFGGLALEEVAVATGRSLSSVKRDLQLAGAWLRRELASVATAVEGQA